MNDRDLELMESKKCLFSGSVKDLINLQIELNLDKKEVNILIPKEVY